MFQPRGGRPPIWPIAITTEAGRCGRWPAWRRRRRVFARALELAPGRLDSFDGLAQTALHLCDWAEVEKSAPSWSSVSMLASPYCPGCCWAMAATPGFSLWPRATPGCPHPAPLRHSGVASAMATAASVSPIISGDFRKHVVGGQIAELIERHDRDRFRDLGLATCGDDGSPVRARLRAVRCASMTCRRWIPGAGSGGAPTGNRCAGGPGGPHPGRKFRGAGAAARARRSCPGLAIRQPPARIFWTG